MTKRSFFCLLLAFFLYFLPASAQELNARITVNSSQIQGSNKEVFTNMQEALTEFLNSRNWTNNVFSAEEKIDCSFQLIISQQVSSEEFKGTLQITANRPVYGSSYSSPLFNFMDKNVQFKYSEGQSLTFSANSHFELTSLFAYYVYIVLGLDYDSFALEGGTPYFEIAKQIVTSAQSSSYSGWKSSEDSKNRYWLVENYLNNIYAPVRKFSYTYHRKGLDQLSSNPNAGRLSISGALPNLLKVHRQKPNSMVMTALFDAKSTEIINVLSEAQTSEGMRAYNILKEIDATNADKYAKITGNN